MGVCLTGAAMGLMATKLFTWLTIVRFHASALGNAVYAVSTLLMLWTYALSVRTDAGGPHLALDSRVGAAEDGDARPREDTGYCERCDANKPPRVHHCSACRRCVYRMDHHCPWTSNCVGWTNKKFFLLFLLYTSISCLSFNVIESPLVFSHDPTLRAVRHAHKYLLQLAWMLTLAIGGILAAYFGFHMWLLHRGITTLEFITGKPGEFEGHPFLFNVRVHFGSNVLLWLVPVAPHLDARLRGRYETQQLMAQQV